MRKLLGVFLSMTLAVSMLAGCGGGQTAPAADQNTESAEAEAEPAAEETEAEPAAEADAAAEQTEAEPAAEQTDAAAADQADAAAGGTVADMTAAADGQALASFTVFNGGGLKEPEAMEEPDEMSQEDTDRLDRAMRAYVPPADSLLKNQAENYYYYNQMNKQEQQIYDALLMCATDPTDTDNAVMATISVDPRTQEFAEMEFKAYYGMLYDHPELFWLYNGSECDISVGAPYVQPGDGTYNVYFFYQEPYEDFEEKMTAFNDAADAFLEDIDLEASDMEIAKAIHDKLIETVTYDTPVMYDDTEAGFRNLAHTAYGALVADSDGNENYAVCDGYSQAYVYLLQQAGIDATVIVGIAGSDKENSGGHAWTVVNLDGDWYEVDSTWDDAGTLDEQLEGIKDTDAYSYGYFKEALTDPDYRNKIQHYLCNLTTPEITDFKVDDFFAYQSKDMRHTFTLLGDSIHIRAGEDTGGYDVYGLVINMAPIAYGTTYKILVR